MFRCVEFYILSSNGTDKFWEWFCPYFVGCVTCYGLVTCSYGIVVMAVMAVMAVVIAVIAVIVGCRKIN
jgi:hypothetical protein